MCGGVVHNVGRQDVFSGMSQYIKDFRRSELKVGHAANK